MYSVTPKVCTVYCECVILYCMHPYIKKSSPFPRIYYTHALVMLVLLVNGSHVQKCTLKWPLSVYMQSYCTHIYTVVGLEPGPTRGEDIVENMWTACLLLNQEVQRSSVFLCFHISGNIDSYMFI